MNTLIPKTSQIELTEDGIPNLADVETSERILLIYLSNCDISYKSRETYRSVLDKFLDYLRDNNISQPTRADILYYKDHILLENCSANTVNLHMSVIRSFFSFTECARIYPNVALNIKGVRSNKAPKHQALSSKQIEDILKSIDRTSLKGKQEYAITLLCSTSGLRVAEVSGLNIGDLCVIQDHSVLMVKGKGYADKTPVVIGPATEKAIRAALQEREETFSPTDPLFISTSNYDRGSRISPKGISKILKKLLLSHGFKGRMYSAHSFRHSACVFGLSIDNDLLGTKRFMRHTNIETTLIYADHQELLGSKALALEIEKKLDLED